MSFTSKILPKLRKKARTVKRKLKEYGKYIIKEKNINDKVAQLKLDDEMKWRDIWNNNGKYIDEEGNQALEEGVGYRHQNMGAYLKKKKKKFQMQDIDN